MTLGRTWETVTTTWGSDVETWGLGLGTAVDSSGLSFTETSSVLRIMYLSVVDSSAFSLAEVQTSEGFFDRADSGSLSVVEARTLAWYSNLVDSGSLSVVTTMNLDAFLVRQDSGFLSLDEAKTLEGFSGLADTGTLSMEELSTSFGLFGVQDSGDLSWDTQTGSELPTHVGDLLQFTMQEQRQLLVDDWPQRAELPRHLWAEQGSTGGNWTQVPPAPGGSWRQET